MSAAALCDLIVLETGVAAAYAGKLLSDHGASVTLIEPPEGSALRSLPPLRDGVEEPETSLVFHYMSAGKRSVVIDLDDVAGQEQFRRAAARASIVLDDRSQRWWRDRGLAFETLAEANPELVWCAITPFGQSGPHAGFKGGELVSMAMGGMAWLAGYDDRPIVSRGGIAARSAALYGAVAALAAALGRSNDGRGRFVDVSVQEVVALGTETGPQFHDLHGELRRRNGDSQKQAGIGVYPCRDGHVMVYAAEAGVGTGWTRLVEWMVETGVEEALPMLSDEWATNQFKQTPGAKAAFERAFAAFADGRDMQDLFVEGQRRRIAIAPVNGPAQVLADPHFGETGYFRPLDIGGRSIPAPGAPFTLSRTPGRSCGRAPSPGEHAA